MTDQITVPRELLLGAIDTINYYASVCGEDDQDTPAKQTQAALRAALEAEPAPVQEPVAWRWAYKGEPDSDKCFPMPVPDQDVQDVAKMRAFPSTVQLLYAAPQAQQPRKAVKLSDDEIKQAIRYLYQDATALQMSMDISLPEFRAIEQAVWEKLGVAK